MKNILALSILALAITGCNGGKGGGSSKKETIVVPKRSTYNLSALNDVGVAYRYNPNAKVFGIVCSSASAATNHERHDHLLTLRKQVVEDSNQKNIISASITIAGYTATISEFEEVTNKALAALSKDPGSRTCPSDVLSFKETK